MIARLKEPSTWAGVGVLLGFFMELETASAIESAGLALFGLVAVLLPEKKGV
jgi:hypothetical protein